MNKPSIDYSMAVVDKNGNVVVRIRAGDTKGRFEGGSAGMVVDGKLTLVHQKEKTVEVFCQAIEKAAADMRTNIETKLTAIP